MKKIRLFAVTACISLLVSLPAFAGWTQNESNQWNYEQNGTLLTSRWLEDQGSWYYFDGNGVMVFNTTMKIDGKDYTFDGDGRWITSKTYINEKVGYSLQIPLDASVTTEQTSTGHEVDIISPNLQIIFHHGQFPDEADPNIFLSMFELGYLESLKGFVSVVDQTQVQIGDVSFRKTRTIYWDTLYIDLYTGYKGNQLIACSTICTEENRDKVSEIINSLTFYP